MSKFIVSENWLKPVQQISSPNYNERPNGSSIDLLVLHNISLPPEQFGDSYIKDFFCNRLDTHRHPYFKQLEGVEVSAHLLITRIGEVMQFVAFDKRAWHAGESEYKGRKNCNDFSIGIELEGSDQLLYTPVQYRQLVHVTQVLMENYSGIDEHAIVGHCEIAPSRKTDPGPAFNWDLFKRQLKVN